MSSRNFLVKSKQEGMRETKEKKRFGIYYYLSLNKPTRRSTFLTAHLLVMIPKSFCITQYYAY